jgi:hypothetical protein
MKKQYNRGRKVIDSAGLFGHGVDDAKADRPFTQAISSAVQKKLRDRAWTAGHPELWRISTGQFAPVGAVSATIGSASRATA